MSTVAQPDAAVVSPRRLSERLCRALLGAVALALALYLAVSAAAALVLTTPQRTLGRDTPAGVGLSYENVRFPARGGDVSLAGWYVPSRAAQRALVLVHGKDSSRGVWVSEGWRALAPALHQRGFALLMIDMRGHGGSGDGRYSFGVNEQRDVQGAADWLKGQGFAPGRIGVLGLSMGAASSIMAAADDPDIGALVADSGYAEVMPLIESEWPGASGLPDAVLPGALLMSRLLLGADIADARPVDAIGRIAPRPVLLIHGDADALVPPGHAHRLRAAAPSAELWQVPGAAHGESFRAQPEEYTRRVLEFFEQSLK
jgi:pimeloyl-ACP methyl ester carboxylesterase